MIIFLIRHGEVGPKPDESGFEITKEGYSQIKHFSERYKDYDFNKILCSQLGRAKATAHALLELNNKPYDIMEEANEIQALLKDELIGTEEYNEEKKRMDKLWQYLNNMTEKKIALISHGNVIRYIMSKVLNIPLSTMLNVDIYPCSTTIVSINEGKNKIILANNYDYIPKKIRGKRFYGSKYKKYD